MPKKLMVLAGSGSPHSEVYRSGYKLIESGARDYGFEEIETISWPGQVKSSSSCSGEFTFDEACRVARSHLDEWQSCGEPFTLLARSFGTLVTAKVLGKAGSKGIDRVILWGPPPYYVMWSLFRRDFQETREKLKKKGTLITEHFFASLEPFEVNFLNILGKVVIVTGTEDEHVPPEFREYLKSMVNHSTRYNFREARGASHECNFNASPEVQKEYLRALFSE